MKRNVKRTSTHRKPRLANAKYLDCERHPDKTPFRQQYASGKIVWKCPTCKHILLTER